jgi:hypothetical protein
MSAVPNHPLSPVDVFAPWAGVEERALRLRIHRAQTIASARASHELNARARTLYYEAGSLATAWVFHRVDDLGDVERILRALNQLFLAADNVAQVEGADAG